MIFRAGTSAIFAIWFLFAAVFGVICCLATLFLPSLTHIILTLFITLLSVMLIYLPLLIKHTHCEIKGNLVISVTGVFFSRTTSVNIKNILYISMLRTPLSQFTSLNFIILNTFGGRTVLLFLSEANCRKIIRMIKS